MKLFSVLYVRGKVIKLFVTWLSYTSQKVNGGRKIHYFNAILYVVLFTFHSKTGSQRQNLIMAPYMREKVSGYLNENENRPFGKDKWQPLQTCFSLYRFLNKNVVLSFVISTSFQFYCFKLKVISINEKLTFKLLLFFIF